MDIRKREFVVSIYSCCRRRCGRCRQLKKNKFVTSRYVILFLFANHQRSQLCRTDHVIKRVRNQTNDCIVSVKCIFENASCLYGDEGRVALIAPSNESANAEPKRIRIRERNNKKKCKISGVSLFSHYQYPYRLHSDFDRTTEIKYLVNRIDQQNLFFSKNKYRYGNSKIAFAKRRDTQHTNTL